MTGFGENNSFWLRHRSPHLCWQSFWTPRILEGAPSRPFGSAFPKPYSLARGIPDLENLKKVFCRYPEIRAVYLFGPRAPGKVHRESDLDLAVLQDGESLPEKKLDILAQLGSEGFCDVDLVFLPKDNIVLHNKQCLK
jgi:predicted nucleotidyltransferase